VIEVSAGSPSPPVVRVCLVEDHAGLRREIRQLLDDSGIDVVAAVGTIRDAKTSILALSPDVAVIDQQLPDGLGIDLIRALAQSAPQVTLLLYTAGVTEAMTRQALRAGAAAVILKSIRADGLIQAIRAGLPLPALTVCLVEDHARLREQLSALLTQSGMSVVAAVGSMHDGETAILSHRPDVAVVDQRLPDGSGIELIRTIAGVVPQVAMFLYTAGVTDVMARAALRAGAAGVILKSIQGDELISAVRGARLQSEPEAPSA
jgi:DNA-binding NarL/FixJ family response regulator